MIQEMATETGATPLVLLSMLLFIVAFAAIAFATWRQGKARMEACARLPLEDDEPAPQARGGDTRQAQ